MTGCNGELVWQKVPRFRMPDRWPNLKLYDKTPDDYEWVWKWKCPECGSEFDEDEIADY